MTTAEDQDPTAIRIERTYAAPAKAVFEAWTSAEMLRRWYPPGADWDTPVAEVDLRVGGRLRIVMRSPIGEEFGGGGEYRETDRTSARAPSSSRLTSRSGSQNIRRKKSTPWSSSRCEGSSPLA